MTERIGAAVKRELGRFGVGGDLPELVAAWPAAVGEAIARNSWPARIARDGTLHANASSSTWVFELTQLADSILERLRAEVGASAPKALKFRVGPVPERGDLEERAAVRTSISTTPEEAAAGAALAAEIENEPLREAVARAAAASLARAADDRPLC